jgi:hypothetical protein
MKNLSFKALLPHLVAVVSFVIIAVIYCKPALEGKVLQQSDIIHWKGMAKDIQDYRATHNGIAPLWTTNMFSGMPGYQIAGNNNNYISYYANEIFSLFIPKPFRFFILACLGFYFLCLVLRINPWLGMTGAIAYAYASYSPIIIAVGHETKMLSMAYVPAVLGGLIMIFDKRYWSGAAFTALFSSILVFHNHYQIVYYFLLVAVFVTAAYAVKWIKEKQYKHMATAAAFAIVAGLIGVLSNAVTLFTTYDYSKATIRGGQASLNVKDSINATKQKGGLDTGYAFLYGSYGVAETFTLMVPDIYGGGPHPLGEESKLVEVMGEKGLPPQLANQLYSSFPAYWGNQPGHSGPVYLGAVICFLFIFGMTYIKSHHKWWIAAVSLLAIMMSWGKNFAAFNTFIFEYLPMYNKFRAPAMILVITQLTFPLLAVLGVQQFLSANDDKTYLWKKLKLAGLITAGVFAVLFLLYISFDYKNDRDKFIQQQLTQMSNGDSSLGRDIVNAAADDRKGLFGKDLFRSFFFIGASFLLLFLYARNKLKATPVIIGLLLLSSIDVLAVGKRYLANDNFMEPEDSDGVFLPTPADAEIKKDTEPNYRVFNLTQDPFNDAITAYHHKSIGGYHAAKLSIYQDLIENQLSKQPMNMPVLDMLNTKYIITTDSAGRLLPQRNPGALGSAWLVKNISFVKDAKEEMRALDNFNPKENAIVQESFKTSVPFMPQWDSAGTIQLVKNDNDIVTYSFNASTNQFAVFSEVYYDRGWKAFIDGKETPIVKVNYVLRGLAVPAGKHNIEFRFEPSSYKTGKQLTGISQLLILGILITGIFLEYRRSKKPVNKA